jgi:hypothetical protein
MKRTIATLIAGLFATAAFAQTPAPTSPAPTQTPASAVSPAVGKAEAQHDKATAQADTSNTKTEVKSTKSVKSAKHAKHAKHVKANNKHQTTTDAAKDSQESGATDAGATTGAAAK